MLLGIVSDTHGHVDNTLAAVRMLESLEVAEVIHCGDIGSPEIIALFSAWPTHFVFGNVDDRPQTLRRAIESAGQQCHERFAELNRLGVRIAVLHGDDLSLLKTTIAGEQFDLICHGHTHVARHERHGKTLVLNPGALYRANPHSLAVVELPAVTATIIPL